MADFNYTTPPAAVAPAGLSVDRVTFYSDGHVEVLLAEKNAAGKTVRNVGPFVVKTSTVVDGKTVYSDAILPPAAAATIRTWIWTRLAASLAAAGIADVPTQGTGT